MELNNYFQEGTYVTQTTLVMDKHTAPHVGSGKAKVLATPVLVNFFEAAALAVIEPALPMGTQSLGTHLDIHHVAATPTKMKVEVTATLVKIEGRSVSFDLVAKDEIEQIGYGTHKRFVVDKEKIDARVKAKASTVSA